MISASRDFAFSLDEDRNLRHHYSMHAFRKLILFERAKKLPLGLT